MIIYALKGKDFSSSSPKIILNLKKYSHIVKLYTGSLSQFSGAWCGRLYAVSLDRLGQRQYNMNK